MLENVEKAFDKGSKKGEVKLLSSSFLSGKLSLQIQMNRRSIKRDRFFETEKESGKREERAAISGKIYCKKLNIICGDF